MTIAEEYVRAGASFLDSNKPSWRSEIDVDSLDISDWDQCVLGQLYGNYGDAVDTLNLSAKDSEAYGFVYSVKASSKALTEAWKGLLVEKYPAGTIVRLAGTTSLRQVQGSVVGVNGVKFYVLFAANETGEFTSSGANQIRPADRMESEYEKAEPIVHKAGDVLKDVEGRFYLVDKELRTWCLNEGVWSKNWESYHQRKLTLQKNESFDDKRYSDLF